MKHVDLLKSTSVSCKTNDVPNMKANSRKARVEACISRAQIYEPKMDVDFRVCGIKGLSS